jgi:hypothetical protein
MPPSTPWEGWKPPEGLNRSWPRRTALTRPGIALSVVSAVFLAGGLLGVAAAARQGRRKQAEARQMRAEGRETEGVVTRMWRGGENNDAFSVEYRFTVDGRVYGGGGSVEKGHWMSLGVGMPIAVRYLPSAPDRNYPSADPPYTAVWAGPLMFGFMAVLGARLPFKLRRQRRLLESGRPAPAVVTRLKKMREEGQYTVYYEFPLLDGARCQGHSRFRRETPEGSAICILYDPDDPSRSAPYPLSLVKLAES